MRRLAGLALVVMALGALPACGGSRQTKATEAAVKTALTEFTSEYGVVESHSRAAPWEGGGFRLFVRGRFTVYGPLDLTQHRPAIAHYTSGWIAFEQRGELLEVSLGR